MSVDAPQAVLSDGRNRRRSRTRSALLSAGEQLFAAKSADTVSVDDIVDVAAVAKGSFYNHFDDKEAFAEAIYDDVHCDLEMRIADINQGIPDSSERVARALCTAILYSLEHPERLQALLRLASARGTAADSPFNAGIRADVRSGVDQRRFALVDVETGVLIVIAVFGVAMRHILQDDVRDVKALALNLGAATLRALGMIPLEAESVAKRATGDLFQPKNTR